MGYYLKDPQSRLDYHMDWASHYLNQQSLASSEWHIAPQENGGLDIAQSGHDDQRSFVVITGGVAGHVYTLTNRVTLQSGVADERTITLRVEAR